MIRRIALAAGLWLLWAHPVLADGQLPPLPYRYLHPPPALAAENKPPASVIRVIPAGYLRAVSAISIFTPDGQAGITGTKGAIAIGSHAQGVDIRIAPVETPAGLPAQVAADSNTYRITAVEQPGSRPARIHKLNITLSWPHFPIAIYRYSDGKWRQLCYADTAVLTSTTISCPTTTLGLFIAVTVPSTTTNPFPTPVVGGPFSWINRYIPLIAALGVIGLCLIAAYFVTRPDRRKKGDRGR